MKRSVPKICFTAWLCFAVVLFTELSTVVCSNTTESTNSTGNDFRSFSPKATSKSSVVDTVGPTTLNTKSHYKETSALSSSSNSLGKFRDIYHSSRIITASSLNVSSNELIGDNLQTTGSNKAEISTKKAGESHSVSPTLLSVTPVVNFASFSVSQAGKTVSNFLSESVRTIAIEDIQGSILKTNIGTNNIASTIRSTPKQELKASSFVKSSNSSHTPIVSHRLSSTITPTLSKLPSRVQSHVEGETFSSLQRFRGHKSLSTQEYTLGTNKLSTQVSSYTVLLKSSSHQHSSEVLSRGNWQKSKSQEDSPSMNTFESSKLVTTTTLKLGHQFQNTSDVSYLVSPSSSLPSLADQAIPMTDSTVTNVNTNNIKTSDLIARPISTPTIPQLSTSVESLDLQSTTTVYKTAEYDTRVSVSLALSSTNSRITKSQHILSVAVNTQGSTISNILEKIVTTQVSSNDTSFVSNTLIPTALLSGTVAFLETTVPGDPSVFISEISTSQILRQASRKQSSLAVRTDKGVAATKANSLETTEGAVSSTSYSIAPLLTQSESVETGAEVTNDLSMSNTVSQFNVQTSNLSSTQNHVESLSSLFSTKVSDTSSDSQSEETLKSRESLIRSTDNANIVSKVSRSSLGVTKTNQKTRISTTFLNVASLEYSSLSAKPSTAKPFKTSSPVLPIKNSVGSTEGLYTTAPLSTITSQTSISAWNKATSQTFSSNKSSILSTDSQVSTPQMTWLQPSVTIGSQSREISESMSTQSASLTATRKITTSVASVRMENSLGSTKSLNLSHLHVVSSLTASQTSKSSTFSKRSVRALPSTSKLEHFQSKSSDSQSRYTTDGISSSKASAQGSIAGATTELSGINISETRNPTISTETSNDVATLDSSLRSTLVPSFSYHDSLSSASVFESTSSKSTPHLELSHRETLSTTTTTVFATSDLTITTALEHYSLSSAATNGTFVTSGTSGIQSSIGSPSKIIYSSIDLNTTTEPTFRSELTTASEHSALSRSATNDAYTTSDSKQIQSSIGSPSKIIYSSIALNTTTEPTSRSKLTTASEHSALSKSATNDAYTTSGSKQIQSSIGSPSKIIYSSIDLHATTKPTSPSKLTTASEHSALSSSATNDAYTTSGAKQIQSSIGSPSKIIYSSIALNATTKPTSRSKLTTASEHSALSISAKNPTFMTSDVKEMRSSIGSLSTITHASINLDTTTEPTSQSTVNPKFSTNVNIISRNTSMTQNLGSVLEPTPSNTIRLNDSLSATITNTSAKLNSTWRQTAVQTSSISSTRESRVTQYCISDTGGQCVCYEGTQVVKGVPVCTQLLNQHERRSVVGIELEKLVDSEKLENRTKDIIAEVVTRACNNGSYQCVPMSENHLNSLFSSYTSPSLRLKTSILTNTSKNVSKAISKTIINSANSSTYTVTRNFSISTAISQNFSRIKPWRTYSGITVNPSVKFKKKRRRRSLKTQPTLLIRVTADDVMVVEMRPVEGTKPALLAFLVRYRILNGSGNGSSVLEAGTLRSILVNNTRYLEGKLNVSIRDVGLWINRVTSERTMWKTSLTSIHPTRALVSSHPGGSTPMVRWSTGQSDDDSKIMIVAIAIGVSCVVMLLVIIAIVMARINSKWQGEFIPGNNLNGTITPDHNTQEMIAASVDPAPRITDVPFKSPKAKKTTKMNLKRPEYMTSEI